MAETVKIAAGVLESARKDQTRLSLNAAAGKLGISISELVAFESGKREPTYAFIQKIARTYDLNEAYFFLDTPLPPRDFKNFRTLRGMDPQLSYETTIALRRVEELQENLAEIASDAEISRVLRRLPNITCDDEIEDIAERERERLQVAIDEQMGWKNATIGFGSWRGRIEELGISVYLEKMNLDDCRGVSLCDDGEFPAIIVNDNENGYHPKIFTLLHEYGHILLRQPGISDEEPRNVVEKFCNRLSAAILMPFDALKVALKPLHKRTWSDQQINDAADLLKVSRWALAIRLEELGFAPKHFAGRYYRKDAVRRRGGGKAIAFSARRLRELGTHYPQRVLNAFQRDTIDRTTASRMLDLRPDYFTSMHTEMIFNRRLYGASTPAT